MKKTTLILGAGVSKDYGYPLGGEFLQDIKVKLKKINHREGKEFLKDLEITQPYSIDSFLNDRRENYDYDIIAKQIIGEILLEKEDKKYFNDKRHHLYQHFFHKMKEKEFNQFNVISFNYDRSLEYFFYLVLSRLKNNELTRKFKEMKIIHIYGRLPYLEEEDEVLYRQNKKIYSLSNYGGYKNMIENGTLEWMGNTYKIRSDHKQQSLSYARDYSSSALAVCSPDKEIHEEARELIKNSERVIFLGFGYHELNMKILGFDSIFVIPIQEL